MSGRKLLAAAVAVALTVGTSWASRVPATLSTEGEALLRLSWRFDAVTVEACRELSAEELERLPIHMRNPQACIGQKAPYVLRVEVDGRMLVADTVRAGGVRGDRPVTVLRDLPLEPGTHALSVSFRAVIPEDADELEGGPAELAWSGRVELAAREVALVKLDETGRGLQLRRP